MKNRAILLAIVILVLVLGPYARAQYTVIQKGVSLSQTLSGHVDVGFDQVPVESALVELCGPDWNSVSSSTKTDSSGYFFLNIPRSGSLFYVRFSAPGIKTFQLRVRITKNAHKELIIHLSNAT
jgi:hypothetical protein